MRRAQELDAVDESNQAMLLRIYALEDEAAALDDLRQAADDAYATLQRSVDAQKEAIAASYDAQVKALDAQQKAAQEAHEAQMDALQAQRDAAAESLQEIESLLSTIQSAIDGFKLEGIDEGAKAFSESMAELQRMARSPMPINQDALDSAVGGLSGFSPDDYATRAEYEADYYATMSAMDDIEKRLGAQKTIEEQMLDSLDAQIDAADAQYEAQMAAFDAQREALDAWRDDQREALDAMLEEAREQLDVLNGINTTIISVEEALIQFAGAVGAYNAANAAVNDASLVQLERSAGMLEQIAEPGGTVHVPADPNLAQDTSEIADLLRRILESSQSLESQGTEQTFHVRDSASTLKRWDMGGLPNERDSAYLEVI
jgi:DNA repair exonuclease SbcCD ATPase subunit